MRKHRHAAFHELVLVLRGELETRIKERVLHGGSGTVFLYPAGEWHEERSCGEAPLETLFLSWTARPGESFSERALLAEDAHGRIGFLFSWLRELDVRESGANRSLADHLLNALLHEIRSLEFPEDDLVRRVRLYVMNNIASDLSLARIAKEANLSPFYFSRIFLNKAGMSPMAFVRSMRTRAAEHLLRNTPLPLKAIAGMTGFADECHLSRVFVRTTGKPPGSLRADRKTHAYRSAPRRSRKSGKLQRAGNAGTRERQP